MDGLCILHSGDVSEPYNEDQLQLIGHIDILLQVIGEVFTAGFSHSFYLPWVRE
jgi:L-ascorbate metabolism protein UlaG (beta-lactamase superfamily)